MTGKTHVICSVSAFAAFTIVHPGTIEVFGAEVQPWLALPGVAVGAFLPDIDIHQSRLGQKFKIISGMLGHRGITHTLLVPAILLLTLTTLKSRTANIIMSLVLGYLVGVLFDKRRSKRKGGLVFTIRNWVSSLRGLIIGLILFTLTMMGVGIWASCAFGLATGWLLHIFEDLFNSKGCPILWPVTKSHFHVMSIKTRHWTESIFLLLWLGGCGIWIFLNGVGNLKEVLSLFLPI